MEQAGDIAKILVVRQYIYARKGVNVRVAVPDTPERKELLDRAYNIAMAWFTSIQMPG